MTRAQRAWGHEEGHGSRSDGRTQVAAEAPLLSEERAWVEMP